MGTFEVGDAVWVRCFGSTLPGTVDRVAADYVDVTGPGGRVHRVPPRKLSRRTTTTANGLVRRPQYAVPTKPMHLRAPSPHRDAAYLAWLRTLPCCFCGASDTEASHHPLDGGSTGMKASDYNAIPLCPACHRGEYHRTGCLPGLDGEATKAWIATRVRWLNQSWLAGGAA